MQMFDPKLPATALLSTVPQKGAGWQQVMNHSCGGFSCDSFDGYAFILPVLRGMLKVVSDIADEQFCEDLKINLDYGVDEDHRKAYRDFLLQHGLTVSDENLRILTQAIYPIDTSEENLIALIGTPTIDGIKMDGLKIAVLGDNCD